jgi:sulfur carrier protein ThiS
MTIEMKIFGFGDDRPAAFRGENQIKLELETPATPWTALHNAGFDDTEGLVLMTNDQVIPIQQWDDAIVNDEAVLMVLCPFEGG